MTTPKPNMKLVNQLRSKLHSEGLLTDSVIKELKKRLEFKRENTSFYMFSKKYELKKTIEALEYLLVNK